MAGETPRSGAGGAAKIKRGGKMAHAKGAQELSEYVGKEYGDFIVEGVREISVGMRNSLRLVCRCKNCGFVDYMFPGSLNRGSGILCEVCHTAEPIQDTDDEEETEVESIEGTSGSRCKKQDVTLRKVMRGWRWTYKGKPVGNWAKKTGCD